MLEHEVVVIEKQVDIVEIGMTGKQGARGFTYIPTVTQNGVLSWVNNGNLPNPPDFDFTTVLEPPLSISNQEIRSLVHGRSS